MQKVATWLNWGDGCKWSTETNTGGFNFLVFIAKKYIGSIGKVEKWCGFGDIIIFLACRISNNIFIFYTILHTFNKRVFSKKILKMSEIFKFSVIITIFQVVDRITPLVS